MKPPRFSYHDPLTVAEALGLLARHGDEARTLAGGQSLVPMLDFRLARPGQVIDINRVGRAGHHESGSRRRVPDRSSDEFQIGALVRQRALERSPLIRERCPLIAQAMPFVGHPRIRARHARRHSRARRSCRRAAGGDGGARRPAHRAECQRRAPGRCRGLLPFLDDHRAETRRALDRDRASALARAEDSHH